VASSDLAEVEASLLGAGDDAAGVGAGLLGTAAAAEEDVEASLLGAGDDDAAGEEEEAAALLPPLPPSDDADGSGPVRAILTMSSRPSTLSFSAACSPAFWSASASNSTNPKPLERPLRLRTMWALLALCALKRSASPWSDIENGRLATNSVVFDGVRLARSLGLLGNPPAPPRPPRPRRGGDAA